MNTNSDKVLTPSPPDLGNLVGEKRSRSGDSGDCEVHPEMQCFDLKVYLGGLMN